MSSFTVVDRNVLRRCIDEYLDWNINNEINKYIKWANEPDSRVKKRWLRKSIELTLDESFDKTVIDSCEGINWLNHSIKRRHEKMKPFENLLRSNNDIYICADDAYILSYLE